MKAINAPKKALKTEKYKGHTIKIVASDVYLSPYTYRHTAPDGEGETFTSGAYSSISQAVLKARDSINGQIERDRKAAVEAKKTPAQKDRDRFNKRVEFFKKHAGSSYGPNETPAQGKLRGAKKLAEAEIYAEDHNWETHWEWDEAPDMSGIEDAKEVYVAVLKDSGGKTLETLGGIADPDNNYRRVVEAELALEAMPS